MNVNHTVFKQKWQKSSENGEVEFIYSIHLNADKAKLFMNREATQPTVSGYTPVDGLVPWSVNEEIYGFLELVNGLWTEEKSYV